MYFIFDVVIIEISDKSINTTINCDLYCIPIVIIDKMRVDNKNAILGFKNTDAIIITAGIGIT